MTRCSFTALGMVLIVGAVLAGTATWEGFEDQMAAHDAAVAAAGAGDSAVLGDGVCSWTKGEGTGSVTLTEANPLDTRFKFMVESAETDLKVRPYALAIILR